MSDLVGNPEDRFSQNEAQIRVLLLKDADQIADSEYPDQSSSSSMSRSSRISVYTVCPDLFV